MKTKRYKKNINILKQNGPYHWKQQRKTQIFQLIQVQTLLRNEQSQINFQTFEQNPEILSSFLPLKTKASCKALYIYIFLSLNSGFSSISCFLLPLSKKHFFFKEKIPLKLGIACLWKKKKSMGFWSFSLSLKRFVFWVSVFFFCSLSSVSKLFGVLVWSAEDSKGGDKEWVPQTNLPLSLFWAFSVSFPSSFPSLFLFYLKQRNSLQK